MRTTIIVTDPMERLAAEFRGAGYPVARIEVEETWVRGGEPDAVAREGRIERSFYAPLFRWRLEDGRRFHGKPKVHLTRHRVRKYFGLLDYEVVQEDKARMMQDFAAMVRESCVSASASAQPEPKGGET